MPSRFPGMDPYLEGQVWEDFHHEFISAIRAALMPQLRPAYGALVEERVYVERQPDIPLEIIKPDVTIAQDKFARLVGEPRENIATAVRVEPVSVSLLMPEVMRSAYLAIRLQGTHEVVTVIEMLSPTHKRKNSDGQREFLAKHHAILQGAAHLVELDLLRGGERIPTSVPLPAGDYFAIVSRTPHRPLAEVWPIALRERLPIIPIPLAGSDPDATLDLQAVFDAVYDRAGYDYLVDYSGEPEPSLDGEGIAWVKSVLGR